MNKLFYLALFHTAEEGGFWITFPDFPKCLTQGETLDEAYDMAVASLGLCITDLLKEEPPLPPPSSPSDITVTPNAIILVIKFNLEKYQRKHNSKAKKTLSIPEWLNEETLALNIPFSAVLHEALIPKIKPPHPTHLPPLPQFYLRGLPGMQPKSGKCCHSGPYKCVGP